MDYQIWATIALWVIAAFFLVLTLVLLFVGIPIALDVKRSIHAESRERSTKSSQGRPDPVQGTGDGW